MAGHAARIRMAETASPANRRSTLSAIRTYDGAVALITDGASGIGAALSRQLAVRGASVVVADRQVECLGADTEAVLTRVLGLTREEVARLGDRGVCR